jgi:nucleolar protein 56
MMWRTVVFMDAREAAFEEARRKLKEAHGEKDALLLHTVPVIEDLDRVANVLVERLREWHGLYFPELSVSEPEAYCKIVLMFDRDNIEESTLSEIVGEEKAKAIVSLAGNSVGSDFSEDDLKQVRALANQAVELYALRAGITDYQAALAKKIAPNICHLVEPALAAKLIAQAGSLKKLALFPASTIQVLGAEKALFKHLRKGTLPPKYGLIFQSPLIGNAPPAHGGKLARALAAKLSTAAKADAFTHEFIAVKLKEGLDRRAAEIAKLPKERKGKPAQRPPEGRDRFQGRRQDFRRQGGSFRGSQGGYRGSYRGGNRDYRRGGGGSRFSRDRRFGGR